MSMVFACELPFPGQGMGDDEDVRNIPAASLLRICLFGVVKHGEVWGGVQTFLSSLHANTPPAPAIWSV